MAANVDIGDEESQFKNRVEPFSSTPRSQNWKTEDVNQNTTPCTSWSQTLGLEEFYSIQVWRASMAELFGTAVFVFAIDTLVISSIESETKVPNLLLSVLIGIVATILLIATYPVSGGHINPIITFAAALAGLLSATRAFIYIVAQCLGGVLGALALKAVVGSNIEHDFSLGGCTLTVISPGKNGPITVGIGTSQALWLEIICSFIFLFASIWMAFDHRQEKALGIVTVRVIVGIVVTLLVFVSTSVTTKKGYAGAGLNPARCLGPAIVRGGHLWDEHWVFWIGPIIACLVFTLYIKIIPRQHIHDWKQV